MLALSDQDRPSLLGLPRAPCGSSGTLSGSLSGTLSGSLYLPRKSLHGSLVAILGSKPTDLGTCLGVIIKVTFALMLSAAAGAEGLFHLLVYHLCFLGRTFFFLPPGWEGAAYYSGKNTGRETTWHAHLASCT